KKIAEIEAKLSDAAAQLNKEFPEYVDLVNPKPVEVEDVQRLLGPDEALVFFLTGDQESYVYALTSTDFAWTTTPIGSDGMTSRVADFRRGLSLDLTSRAAKGLGRTAQEPGKPDLFDLDRAYGLCMALLGPVESLIGKKSQLIIVPSGALTALPFHLLVTSKP